MSFLVLYKYQPENSTKYFLKAILEDMGLHERNLNINILSGHPLFVEGNNQDNIDNFFPALGVEWTRDKKTQYVSSNFKEIKNTDALRSELSKYKETVDLSDRAASDQSIERLIEAEYLQRFSQLVESEVILAGFTAGGQARQSLRIFFETIDGILPALAHDIMRTVQGVKVEYDDPEVNLFTESFGFPAYGFEIKLKITQPRIVYKTKTVYPEEKIKRFDIHLENSRLLFNLDYVKSPEEKRRGFIV